MDRGCSRSSPVASSENPVSSQSRGRDRVRSRITMRASSTTSRRSASPSSPPSACEGGASNVPAEAGDRVDGLLGASGSTSPSGVRVKTSSMPLKTRLSTSTFRRKRAAAERRRSIEAAESRASSGSAMFASRTGSSRVKRSGTIPTSRWRQPTGVPSSSSAFARSAARNSSPFTRRGSATARAPTTRSATATSAARSFGISLSTAPPALSARGPREASKSRRT